MPLPTALVPPAEKIHLPALHPGQREVAYSGERFKVVVCGRRWGKTVLGIWLVVKGAMEKPGIYFWVGPNYPEIAASGAWNMLKRLLAPLGDAVSFSESEHYAVLWNGSEIWIKSGENPDSLRGPKLRGVVADEFAQLKDITWTEVLRPALMDHKGWALFIGTPRGKNWAYRLFERAKVRTTWRAWRKPTMDNPFIDAEEIEEMREDCGSEEVFAQEILADFGVSQFLVFPEVDPDVHEWREPLPEFISYHGGLDFGGDTIGAHKSAVALAGKTAKDELIIFAAWKQSGPNIAERQVNWIYEQENRLKDIHRILQRRPIQPLYRADKSQMTGIQLLRNSGLAIYKSTGGQDSVDGGIQAMHRRLSLRTTYITLSDGTVKQVQRPRLYWYKGGEGIHFVRDDLMKYRYPEPNPVDEVQKKNPLKVDDDLVDAIRYLVEGADMVVIGDPMEIYAGAISDVAR